VGSTTTLRSHARPAGPRVAPACSRRHSFQYARLCPDRRWRGVHLADDRYAPSL